MSKEDFISGTVLEFKVPLNLGYAYCKVLDFRHIREFDGVLVKVFDHFVTETIKDINILQDKDWLFGARRMPWLPGTRGRGAWKAKGVLIAEDDNIIPDFKYCIKATPFVKDESILEPWDAVRNIDSYVLCSYDKVRHLEDTVLSPTIAIELRAAMEYCRIHRMEISEYFDLTKKINEIVYMQMIKVPTYKTIPAQIRGKALCDMRQS